MTSILESLKVLRHDLGFTQVELAHRSGVSLPSIQNIEKGAGNPSFETLGSLAASLGLELKFQAKPADWDNLCFFGAPLLAMSPKKNSPRNAKGLVDAIRQACIELKYSEAILDRERKQEALESLLLALEGHYPSTFKKYCKSSPLILGFMPKSLTGRLIKLKRISVARIAEYL